MNQLNANPQRVDPYKNFKFRLRWGERYVAGFSEVTGLTVENSVVDYREGDDPTTSRRPNERTEYEAITLERGLTYDRDFGQWATETSQHEHETAAEASLKDVRIELCNERGEIVAGHTIHRCRVLEFQTCPDLERDASAMEIQHLKLVHRVGNRRTENGFALGLEPRINALKERLSVFATKSR